MLGRAAYQRPWLLADVDRLLRAAPTRGLARGGAAAAISTMSRRGSPTALRFNHDQAPARAVPRRARRPPVPPPPLGISASRERRRRAHSARPRNICTSDRGEAGLDLLVVLADFGIFLQMRIDLVEHRAHPRFRHRAFAHHDQLRLVRGRAHQPPGAVLQGDAHAVDGDEPRDLLTGELAARREQLWKNVQ